MKQSVITILFQLYFMEGDLYGIPYTGLTTPVGLLVTPTDRPKSVRNRCVIEVFGGVCVCCPLVFGYSVGVRGFVIGLGQISFFFSRPDMLRFPRVFIMKFMLGLWRQGLNTYNSHCKTRGNVSCLVWGPLHQYELTILNWKVRVIESLQIRQRARISYMYIILFQVAKTLKEYAATTGINIVTQSTESHKTAGVRGNPDQKLPQYAKSSITRRSNQIAHKCKSQFSE